jgi:hypothetical protein
MMRRIREGRLPSSEVVVETAFRELNYGPNGPGMETVRREFNQRLQQVFEYTLEVLERYEERAYATGIPDELIVRREGAFRKAERAMKRSKDARQGFQNSFRMLFAELYPTLRQVFLSISQSRKARGGKDFELEFGRLLDYAGVPYQRVSRQTRTDFMVPSDDTFNSNRNIALVLSAKRTLRERWREVAEELFNLRSPNVYLITADDNVSAGHVEQICRRYRIYLVVWDKLKESDFGNDPFVLGYSELLNEVIPIFESRWR